MIARSLRALVNDSLDWLTIAFVPGLGPRTARSLLARGPLGDVLRRPRDHADLLPEEAISGLETGRALKAAELELRRAERQGVRLVTVDAPEYPGLLREIYDPPVVLWVLGRLSGLEEESPPAVAIVGTRGASPQGRALARSMARDLAAAGATIVSGLARGIDAAAHEGVLESRGRTLAVLGSGVDRVYPPEHVALAARIVEQGAVVSELPLGTAPFAGNFPKRNRIIAGLSRAVVVVEAPQRSGALVTARLALDEGREVLAVPGHPSSPGAAGTNALIRDGAVLARDARDVAEAIGACLVPVLEAEPADEVLRVLERDQPKSLDEIQERCGRPTAELLSRLTALELTDRVRRLPGTLFVKS